MILKDLKKYIEDKLISIYNHRESESLASLIIEDILLFDRTSFIINSDKIIESNKIDEINLIIERLQKEEPIQYILGKTEFYDLVFNVNKHTLIPRQETELLVDKIIKQNSISEEIKILDIGTGTACIAISLSKNIKNAKVSALDISYETLNMAKENAILNKEKINFITDDILNPINIFDDKFDIIVSNPPYVTENEKSLMQNNVLDYEPDLALFVPNKNPLKFYIAICNFASNNLEAGGQLWLEINEQFGYETVELLKKHNFTDLRIIKDLNEKDRIVTGVLK